MLNLSTHYSMLLGMLDPNQREGAWMRFQGRYEAAILGWLRARGLQDADARGVAQMVMEKVFRKLDSYHQSEGKFRHWLGRVVRNALMDFFRHRQAHAREAHGVGGEDDALARLAAPEAADGLALLIAEEAEALYAKAVARARARGQDEDVWLAYRGTVVEERDALEVAAQLGMPVARVYKYRSRFCQRIEEEYAKLERHGRPNTDSAP